ncbi:MAG: FAD-binding and (Fe-S)-binding domain-containing protein [Dehalococcoidales bacterium]|nr:FAD-binding and (Fe-S)-binding domain-containing protein [Dehalococcoidales bacterium]
MDKQIQAQLKNRFEERVSFDHTEMLLYSHDTASLPGMIKSMVNNIPEAVVQPLNTDDVIFVTKFARQHNIPITPRGGATSGWGGALPTRGGIVVDFSRMRHILKIDTANGTALVEAGVVWKNIEYELNKQGLSSRIVPSSALSATVGGWVAEGGGGIGSYEYGQIGNNIISVKMVTPEGEVKTLTGEELELVTEAEGITGLITEVLIMTRLLDNDVPVVASFLTCDELLKAIQQVNEKRLPLYHVSFYNAVFLQKQDEAALAAAKIIPHWGEEEHQPQPTLPPRKYCQALFVYPSKRESIIKPSLLEIIQANGGQIADKEETENQWHDRFFPIRLKRLGPSLVSSEAVVSVPVLELDKVIEEIERKFPDVAITATMLNKQAVSILANMLGDERSAAYTFEFTKSLEIIDIACKYGGSPYSTGLYFTHYAKQNLGGDKVKRLLEYKKKTDPQGIMNPGKILPENRNPKTLKFMMGLAQSVTPLVKIGRKVFSHKPKLAKRIPPQIAYEAYACAQCGYCIDVCDQYYGRQWESETSRGRWYFLRQYLEGKAKFDQKMLDSFLLCTTCQRCNNVCQVQIPIQQMWDQMRGLVIDEKGYHTFPGFEMMASAFLRESNIWAGSRHERAKWLPADVKPQEKGKIAYWAGCTASFVEHDIAQNAVHILKEGRIEFAYLGKEEACCGIPFLSAGKWDLFAKAVEHNIKELNRRGVEEVVVSCPGCWVTLNHYYREWAKKLGLKYDIKVKHITEVAAELVKDGKLKFKQAPKDGGKITYHDPCHIGRHGGIYEPPREVLKAIPGVELVEMEHNRENGLCCGSVLSRVGRPPAADAIGIFRMKEAEASGAGIVLTTCPCCEVQLRVGARAGKSPVRVLDFSDVVVEALGYEVKDPTHSVLDAWDVFGVAIDMMTVPGMADMMEKMMPEIMNAMPGVMKGMMSMIKSMPAPLRHPMLKMMEKMIPLLMPMLLPGMLPALMPKATELMKQAIPNMPPAMKAMLPDMLPEVMAKIMPPMLPGVAPLIAPKMVAYLESQAVNK